LDILTGLPDAFRLRLVNFLFASSPFFFFFSGSDLPSFLFPHCRCSLILPFFILVSFREFLLPPLAGPFIPFSFAQVFFPDPAAYFFLALIQIGTDSL